MDECLTLPILALALLSFIIPLEKAFSSGFTPTCMTLELTDCSITQLISITEDVDVKTERALIDVYKGELTLRVRKEAITFNLDQTLRYSSNYDDNSVNRIDVIEMACAGVIVIFHLEEVDAFLALEDDPTSPEVDHSYYDPEGDILLLEALSMMIPSYPCNIPYISESFYNTI
ncbi:hypothetical protein Tco_0783211 [Tanacetum coccineum]